MSKLSQAKRDEKLVRQAFLDAFPNPDRVGCPGDKLLRQIARRQMDPDESLRRHMRSCSPCTQDLLIFRRQWRNLKAIRFAFLAAAAAVLIFAGIYQHSRFHSPSPKDLIAGNEHPLPLETDTLDFYQSAIQRGTDNPNRIVQTVRSSARILMVILPISSQPGEYEFEIRKGSDDGDAIKLLRATASYQSDGRTALELDLGSLLRPGSYGAAFRPKGSNLWSYGTFTVH